MYFKLLLVLLVFASATPVTIFQDTFTTLSGWEIVGSNVNLVTSPRIGGSGSSLRFSLNSWAQRTISTVGYNSISVSVNIAAASLENSIDRCLFEYSLDKGASFYPLIQLKDGQDNSVFVPGTFSLSGAEQNSVFTIRFIARVDATGDNCYGENVVVSGVPATPPTPPSMVLQTNFDNLSGNGAVTRTLLTFSDLTSTSQPISTVDLSAFAVPTNAAQPTNYFHGYLETIDHANFGSSIKIRDDYNYLAQVQRTRMPKIYHRFVQHGSHIIPEVRTYAPSSHPYWEYIFSPGRVWNENSDNGYSRVAIPYAITQRNANCIHNGILTFLFKTDASGAITAISRMVYQISQETCLYFKVDLWAKLTVNAQNVGFSNAATLRTNYEAEVASRIPTRPISQLTTDYPSANINVSKFGSQQTPEHLTMFGLFIDGIHYRGPFPTRKGSHPYPESIAIPSYSTSKSFAVATLAMALAQKYPTQNVLGRSISSLVPQCPSSRWGDVTIKNAIDMATGNYGLSSYMGDEGTTAMTNDYFLRETYGERIDFMCNKYLRKATPSSTWIYHTPDHNLAYVALDQLTRNLEGISGEQFILNNIDVPLSLSPTSQFPKRTYDVSNQISVWGAYGFFELADDIVKFGNFLNAGEGKIGSTQVLDYTTLKRVMQRDPINYGLTITVPGSSLPARYNGGFWAFDYYGGSYSSCPQIYEPQMRGYGGIGIHLLKNEGVYYYVSDNDEFGGEASTLEAAKIRAPCPLNFTP